MGRLSVLLAKGCAGLVAWFSRHVRRLPDVYIFVNHTVSPVWDERAPGLDEGSA